MVDVPTVSLGERIAKGRAMIAEAREQGRDTTLWESHMHALEAEAADLAGVLTLPPLPKRYAWEVRWAREMGYVQVRDVFTGDWHEVPVTQCPESWIKLARATKAAERLAPRDQPAGVAS